MSQKEDFISQEPAMKALAVNEVKSPNMPVDVAAQEAEDQYNVATIYEAQLITAGVTTETIALLLTRANALRETEAQWRTIYNSEQKDVKNWEEQAPAGYALKKGTKFWNQAIFLGKDEFLFPENIVDRKYG